VENRRRAERRSALWMGRCHIEDEPSDLWRECTVIDVSTLGVGIDLCHPDPVELLGLWQDGVLRLHAERGITVRVEPSPSVDMTVAGQVRNAGSKPDGTVRAGIEFVGLSETERSIVESERRVLRRMHLRLRRAKSLLPGTREHTC
jgi:PilZ domain